MTTISDQADAMVRANGNYRPAGATRRTYSTQWIRSGHADCAAKCPM